MNLYLMCHGIVAEHGADEPEEEAQRGLAHRGRKRCEKIARNFGRLGLSFDLIMTSPFACAYQTAEIVADVLDVSHKRILESENLSPLGFADQLIDEINAFLPAKSLLIVGHEAYLVKLIGVLLSGDESLVIQLKKAGVCKLSMSQLVYARCAMLEWLMTPTQLIGI